jgi:hypothetical protein
MAVHIQCVQESARCRGEMSNLSREVVLKSITVATLFPAIEMAP